MAKQEVIRPPRKIWQHCTTIMREITLLIIRSIFSDQYDLQLITICFVISIGFGVKFRSYVKNPYTQKKQFGRFALLRAIYLLNSL